MVGGFLCLLPYHRVVLPSSLERSLAVSTPDTPHISPVLRSQLNSTLFSFHSAGWSSRSPRDSSDGQNKPRGAASSQIICKSWNRGHCVAPSALCRFAHKCASCHGPHHAGVCPAETPTKPSSSSKCSPDSPPPWSSSKSHRV